MWYILVVVSIVFIGLLCYSACVIAGRVDDQMERDWTLKEKSQGYSDASPLRTEHHLDHTSEQKESLEILLLPPTPKKINTSP